MLKKPKVCVLRTDGTNCDRETRYAFNLVNGNAEIVHINSLKKGYDPVKRKDISLDDYHILALPGGFSYGDYISAGKILAEDLRRSFREEIQEFIDCGKLIIGICNGFQVLVKSGFLPGSIKNEQTTTLTYNNSQRFEDRWVRLIKTYKGNDKCVWTKGIDSIDLPVAHGEGKFVAPKELTRALFNNSQVVFQYSDKNGNPTMEFPANPNGSLEAIAGICDETGRVFGLMPHPERYNHPKNYYLASLQEILSRDYIDKSNPVIAKRLDLIGEFPKEGAGLQIFRNGVDYVVNNLL